MLVQEHGGGAALDPVFLDGSNVRAHRYAANAVEKGPAPSGTRARSRSGFGTTAITLADGHDRTVAFVLAPSQAHEAPLAPALLDGLPNGPG